MKIRLALSLLLASAGLPPTSAAAQQISRSDRMTIASRVAAFDTVMKEGRTADTLDFVPPRLLDAIAKKFGVPAAAVKSSMGAQIARMLKDVKFVSFRMDLSAATEGVTPDNSRTYLLIPTETVLDAVGAGRLQGRNTTLALKDEGIWYLVRIDGAQQIATLREVYPEFAKVDFPTGSMTPVK